MKILILILAVIGGITVLSGIVMYFFIRAASEAVRDGEMEV